MTITIHRELLQGTDEWFAARRGILTASEMKLIITPTLKVASNEKERQHLYELAGQRITEHVEPTYEGGDMIRGKEEEVLARALYAERYAPVEEVGFVTNDRLGFLLGCSPDGLVGEDGCIEAKSRRQKYQVETIVEGLTNNEIPTDYVIQVQSILLVTGRKWCDFLSYCGGMPMVRIRVFPDLAVQDAIIKAATEFEGRLLAKVAQYRKLLELNPEALTPTERTPDEQEIGVD